MQIRKTLKINNQDKKIYSLNNRSTSAQIRNHDLQRSFPKRKPKASSKLTYFQSSGNPNSQDNNKEKPKTMNNFKLVSKSNNSK